MTFTLTHAVIRLAWSEPMQRLPKQIGISDGVAKHCRILGVPVPSVTDDKAIRPKSRETKIRCDAKVADFFVKLVYG